MALEARLLHEGRKVLGPLHSVNVGNGKFRQYLRQMKCSKRDEYTNSLQYFYVLQILSLDFDEIFFPTCRSLI